MNLVYVDPQRESTPPSKIGSKELTFSRSDDPFWPAVSAGQKSVSICVRLWPIIFLTLSYGHIQTHADNTLYSSFPSAANLQLRSLTSLKPTPSKNLS